MSKERVRDYSLKVPETLWNKLEEIAERREQSVLDVIKTCFRVGIAVMDSEDTPGEAPLLRVRVEPLED